MRRNSDALEPADTCAMSTVRLPILLRTLPFLKINQMAYQIVYRGRAALPERWRYPKVQKPGITSRAETFAACTPFLQRPFLREAHITDNRFTFLNQPITFGAAIDWQTPARNRLWRYNLHYFDYLFPDRSLNWDAGCRLMLDWIAANPVGSRDAWDPFPTSLRIVNWIKFISSNTQPNSTVPKPLLGSLHHQVLHLERSLEYHLLANHHFKNIKALLFAALFLKGPDARRWQMLGCRLLGQQIKEQVLDDGGHFERSPMYHAMILEDVLDLLNILQKTETAFTGLRIELTDAADRMMNFLSAMTHPDGDIALFNDAAVGIEHTAADLTAYYAVVTGQDAPAQIRGSLKAFPDSGYFIMAPSKEDRLIIDCGAIGPDYQPGHAHCDTLSFELSLHGRRVIVDSGCCRYEDSPIRQYNRGNAGHNTVTIDGQNQSEVWAAHRCARRAYPTLEAFGEELDGSLVFKGSHDGYGRLPGRPRHQRTIHWKEKRLKITDRIEGEGRHHILATLHLNPDLDLRIEKGNIIISDDSGALANIRAAGHETIEIVDGWYCPEFNRQLVCKKLAISFEAALPAETGWLIEIR